MQLKNMRELHDFVCERDGYICQGYRDGKHAPGCRIDYSEDWAFDEKGINLYVCACHIESRGSNPAKAFDPDGSLCKSKPCHFWEHQGVE